MPRYRTRPSIGNFLGRFRSENNGPTEIRIFLRNRSNKAPSHPFLSLNREKMECFMNDDVGSNGSNGLAPREDRVHPPWIRNAIQRHESSLLRYAQHFVHNLETARDIVQDTFLQLCRHPDDDIESRVAQWLFTVCRNRAIDICRQEGRMKLDSEMSLTEQVDPVPEPIAIAERSEAVAGLSHQISRLPDNQQEVLRLKFQADLSYQQIAEVTGLSPSNVGFLLHSAIARLRVRLSDHSGCNF